MIGRRLSAEALVQGVQAGDRAIIGQCLSLAASARSDDQALALSVLEVLLPNISPAAVQIGITGPPGAGKSSLIEALGTLRVNTGQKLAVLAVDPTSRESGGSILGDKTRMETLARHPLALVRPAPSSGHLGGATTSTREEVAICHAAGYDTVLIETVGVGQSETEIADMADLTVLVLPPAAGDDLQGVKRGIVEIADIILINKADGALKPSAEEARRQYAQALHLFPPREDGWEVPVYAVSAETGVGLEMVWPTIDDYLQKARKSGYLHARRVEQRRMWFRQSINKAWWQALVETGLGNGLQVAEEQAVLGNGWPPALARQETERIMLSLKGRPKSKDA
jgi:LAO/AO transport system kinase